MKMKGNKTKRKRKQTIRIKKIKGKNMKKYKKKRTRKRNKVKLHNTLMKGGSGEPKLLGFRVPDILFHDPPPPAPQPGNADADRILKDYNHFNIRKILEWLGISVSKIVISICNRLSKCSAYFQILQDINFDIKKYNDEYNDGYNLVIDHFHFKMYLEEDPDNQGLYISPSIKFNIKDILNSVLKSNGASWVYDEGATLDVSKVSVIETFRNQDISIRFEYEIKNIDGNNKGELRLNRSPHVEGINGNLIIGERTHANENQIAREMSMDVSRDNPVGAPIGSVDIDDSLPVDPT